jgi:hypothetical protein
MTTVLILAGVVLTFLTAVAGFWQAIRKIAEVHVLVNSQLHQVLMRVTQLTGTLHAAGVDVPADPGGEQAERKAP